VKTTAELAATPTPAVPFTIIAFETAHQTYQSQKKVLIVAGIKSQILRHQKLD
jgi:hypothetical protein